MPVSSALEGFELNRDLSRGCQTNFGGGDATAPGGPEGDGETESPGTHQFELNRD